MKRKQNGSDQWDFITVKAKSDKPNRPLRRTDGDFPIAWTRSHDQGRVFYCSLGHALSTFSDPTVLKFWLRGIQFATGDIQAETTGK